MFEGETTYQAAFRELRNFTEFLTRAGGHVLDEAEIRAVIGFINILLTDIQGNFDINRAIKYLHGLKSSVGFHQVTPKINELIQHLKAQRR